ncbi:MAG: crosslink repair DNA glycosylase YcaQ family protein [Nakamurella sp.]
MPARKDVAAALTSAQVRAHRILASGLARTARTARSVPVWELGLQDRDGSARVALAARLPDAAAVPAVDEPAGSAWLTMAWSLRGSPHLHRRVDLARVAAALWPADDADAAARLAGDASRLTSDGADPLTAFAVVADGMREVITEPMVKGVASAALTRALPEQYSGFCQGCGSVHVRELLFRLAALPAAVGAVPDTKPIVLAPLSEPFQRPTEQQGLAALAAECYRLFGVATPGDVATHLGTSAGVIPAALPDDLVTVTVDGARSKARAADLDDLRAADVDAAGELIRLLPPGDPLLQPRDRAVLTTDRVQQRALWPAIGNPGAVLAGGGLAGLWRTRRSGTSLTVTITPWRRITAAERAQLEREVEVVGAVRDARVAKLVVD